MRVELPSDTRSPLVRIPDSRELPKGAARGSQRRDSQLRRRSRALRVVALTDGPAAVGLAASAGRPRLH